MNCELCGRESELYDTVIESIELSVCKECSKFGNVIRKKEVEEEKEVRKPIAREQHAEFEKDIVVDNYGEIVKSAREKKQMTQEELARALAEKESAIHKIESGQIIPQMKTIKKLEQFLKIKLIADYDQDAEAAGIKLNFKDDTITIGDIVKVKEKKK